MGNYAISNSLELDDNPYALEDSCHFRFDQWLHMNGLNNLKNLFIKHGMVTPNTLTVSGDQFRNLIHDQTLLMNAEYIPKIVDALHTLHTQIKTPKKKSIIIDQDDEIFEEIQQNIELLHSVRVNINKMNLNHTNNELYLQSARIEQTFLVEETKNKINASFDNIAEMLRAKQNMIINELNSIKSISAKTEHVHNDPIEESDQKSIVPFKLNLSRNELLIFGYIRKYSLVLIPLDVITICEIFYQCWDTYNIHKDIIIYSNMICRKYPCSSGWITTFAAEYIVIGTKVVKKLKLVQNMESNIIRYDKICKCWIIIGIFETAKITQFETIGDFTDKTYGGVGLCLYDNFIYSCGSYGENYGVYRSDKKDNRTIMYDDVISIEIDHKTREKCVMLRYKINEEPFSDIVYVDMKGDVSIAVAINAGETDYIQLIM